MQNLDDVLADYNYKFPKSAIAQKPASPRDSSRVLVYDRATGECAFDRFLNLADYLPANAVIVFNETKVIPARLILKKETGGKVIVIFVEKTSLGLLKVMSDRKLKIGSQLRFSGLAKARASGAEMFFNIEKQDGKFYFLRPSFPINKFSAILNKYGITPIPPYIKNTPLTETQLRQKYQTVFAHTPGSIAAPTASLHFTKRLIEKMKRKGVDVKFVTLHVNLGTFAPLRPENLEKGRLHEEFFEIDAATARFLSDAKRAGRPIVGVGTTVVRTLESASKKTPGKLSELTGTTDLFIREGYKFKFVDQMITNFHVPQSSLMMLVSAFATREKLLQLYKKAIAKKFRLFSFGDGMYLR